MNVPAVVELQDTVAVAGNGGITLSGVMAPQVKPAGIVSVNATVPAKPFRAPTVIVEVAEEPALTAAGEVAAIVKSTKVKVAVAGWTRTPLVPVTVTEKVPAAAELQDRVAVAGNGGPTLAGAMSPHVRPTGTVSVRATVPAKPPTEPTVIVEVADEPAFTAAGEVAAIVKSAATTAVTVTLTTVELVIAPLVPPVPVNVTAKVVVVATEPLNLQLKVADPPAVNVTLLVNRRVLQAIARPVAGAVELEINTRPV
jgi:hypothetical protein